MESALVEHEAVAEAAVVGRPHPVKGESLYCFVTLNEGVTYGRTLEAELKRQGLIPILEPVPLASSQSFSNRSSWDTRSRLLLVSEMFHVRRF